VFGWPKRLYAISRNRCTVSTVLRVRLPPKRLFVFARFTHTTAELSQRANEWRGSNNARYSSPEYDRLWRNLKGETDPNQRSALTVQLNDHLIREAVIVPLVARRTPVSAKAKRLQGIIPNPWDSELWNIADWTMTP